MGTSKIFSILVGCLLLNSCLFFDKENIFIKNKLDVNFPYYVNQQIRFSSLGKKNYIYLYINNEDLNQAVSNSFWCKEPWNNFYKLKLAYNNKIKIVWSYSDDKFYIICETKDENIPVLIYDRSKEELLIMFYSSTIELY